MGAFSFWNPVTWFALLGYFVWLDVTKGVFTTGYQVAVGVLVGIVIVAAGVLDHLAKEGDDER